ncbi:MAG: hypothetical protein NC930_02230 [Candidatus Omnitrophica bacterium]|nr:hypothetical protein [Candidatus Omnitrophota bacterium]
MPPVRKIQWALIRCLILVLCFFSFQRAGAALLLYGGKSAFYQGALDRALGLFQKADRWDSNHPEILFFYGQSLYRQGISVEGQEFQLQKASEYFEKLTIKHPYFSKGWLYRALSQLALARQDLGDRFSRNQWEKIRSYLETAYRAESGSPWIKFMVGKTLLSYDQFLTDSERKKALSYIKRAVEILPPRHLELPPCYLRSALAFLWNRFHNFGYLKYITPHDYPSIGRLLEFMDQRQLWSYRHLVYPLYLKLGNEIYDRRCRLGKDLLDQEKYAEALVIFKNTYWVNQWRTKAKMGMLAAQQAMGAPLPDDYENILREILEEKEIAINEYRPWLGPLVQQAANPYLKGLYYFYLRDYAEARKWLEESSVHERYRRRLLGECYWRLGESEKALAIVTTVLNERNPDLRELTSFARWDSVYRQNLEEKIKTLRAYEQPQSEWGSKISRGGLLDHAGIQLMPLNLKPGFVVMHLATRSSPGDKGIFGYVIFRLGKQNLGGFYIPHEDWREITLRCHTAGGYNWLTAYLLNGSKPPDGGSGPSVELGPVRVLVVGEYEGEKE